MEVPKIVQELPPAPADVREWILHNVVQSRYMIYSTKEDRAVCSYCGHEFKLGELGTWPKHNEKGYCPDCGEKVIYKSEGVGRKNLIEMTRTMIFVKKGKSIFATIADIDITFDEERPEVYKWISAVYKFNSKEQLYYYHHPEWCFGPARWEQRKRIKVPGIQNMGAYPPRRWGLHVYTGNFDKVFKNTDLKYADVEEVCAKYNFSAESLFRYILLSSEYQSIEILRKAGLWSLVKSKICEDPGSRSVNWKAKELRKILGLNMAQIKEIKEADFDLRDLEIYKRQIKAGDPLTPDEIDEIKYNTRVDAIRRNAKVSKALRYIARQKEKYKHRKSTVSMYEYEDYLIECERLGYNMTEKKTLFPKDLANEHKRTSKLIMEQREKIDSEAFARFQFIISGMTEPYISEGLLIRPADNQKELSAEGQSLGHCVAGYGSGVSQGNRAVLFIRKTSQPDKSYYTLELGSKKEIRQCRGKANCDMTDEVKAFVDKWYNEIILGKKPKRKKKVA